MNITNRINELLDEAKKKTGTQSDYKLAQVLELTTQNISEYRHGRVKPDAYACARIAAAINKDPMELIAEIEGETAKSQAKRDFWKSFRSFGRHATLGLLLWPMWSGFMPERPTGHTAPEPSATSHNLPLHCTRSQQVKGPPPAPEQQKAEAPASSFP